MPGAPSASKNLPAASYVLPPSADQLMQLQQEYLTQVASLWTDFFQNPAKSSEPIADSRFSDPAWQSNSLASFYARAYLLNSDFMSRLADSVDADRKTKQRVKFAVSQWVDAASPSNFLATNPKAQQALLESRGESLKSGLDNLMKDMQRGRISQTDETAFEVGRNVATSEGQVVFENALFQLIQYKPLTAKVYARPFVLVPPCINKYYILDLQPENSFIRHAVQGGHTVFVVSWKNPHEPEAKLTWDDYLERGAIEAIHVAQQISGQKQVNALGFCVGGTILATALAVMIARGESPVSSLTMMTALLDFEDPGMLGLFIDEQQVRQREQALGKGGLMPGRDLAITFNNLRSNDLVWNYVVNNYLQGKQPPAFDLLYWNGDSTNLPGPMYAWYLRNMYLENNLRVPGKLVCCGERIDLGTIKVPTYVFAAREDHIVPWKAAYASARLLPGWGKGGVRFVLGASGHIAGSINPPSKNKRSYWTSPSTKLPADPEAWLLAAEEQPGSWWTDWSNWLAPFGGAQKAAPKSFGNTKYKAIEPAPGRYVREKA
ncbi:MAG TPA: class I poly(R)-hydroxyalkanoic acid synthase [Burkholderiaceae bacterium]|nr:class I poly(R)-hydroxyalkanoic acid synthase [Burkholderiaceae bacterium]